MNMITHADPGKIDAFCRRWNIRELALFGSATREDFELESDIDLLVTFAEDTTWGLLDLVRMEEELEAIFGRSVDLVTRRGVERSRNWIRRKAILESVEPIYGAG